MSDTVDNVLNTVNESEQVDVVVNEETPVEAPVEEATEPVEEAPVASASETESAEPAEEIEEPAEEIEEPVSVEEVVQNVQEILTTPSNEDLTDKERLVQLEKRLNELITILRSVYKQYEVDDEQVECIDFNFIKDKLNNV
jgi:hypothetical protein